MGMHAIVLGDATTMKANGIVEVFGDRNFLALTGMSGRGVAGPISDAGIACLYAAVEAASSLRADAANEGAAAQPLRQVSVRGRSVLDVNTEALSRRSNVAEDPERARSALLSLSSDRPYESWLRLIWAFKDGVGDSGFALVDAWSQTAPLRYSAEAVRAAWDSDSSPVGGIGVGTLFKMARDAGWKDPALPSPVVLDIAPEEDAQPEAEENDPDVHATDLGLARVFAGWYVDGFKFDHAARVWLTYSGGAWVRCRKGEQQEAFKKISGRLLQEAGKAQGEGNSDKAKKFMSCAMRAQSAHGIESALKLASSDPRLADSTDEFDRDPDLFNVANGVVHLPTGELRPHDPALMLSRQSPVYYDPGATAPRWLRFLDEVSCLDADWVEYLQRVCGYTLSGYVSEEKLFFMLGNGANGKSVLANIVRRVFGPYGVVVPSAFLMLSQRDGGSATPELMMVSGARLVLANEVEAGAMLSGQMVKVAVSTEAITARALYAAPVTFLPTHKL